MIRFAMVTLLLLAELMAVEVLEYTPKIANGQVGVIAINAKEARGCSSVELGEKEFPFMELKKGVYTAFIPVSYYAKAHKQHLKLTCKEKSNQKVLDVTVYQKNYPREEIHVDKKKVNPKSKEVRKRIAQEYAEAMAIYNSVTPQLYIDKPFIIPFTNPYITSEFGKARVYNDTLKGYHSGVDFRAKTPTPVQASNSGKVVLAKDRFYSGNTVVIDHGKGLYTCYFHLSRIDTHKGDILKRGDILGLSGDTGRVTGPHLHFGVRIVGVQVDPLTFLHTANKFLQKEEN